MSFELRLTENGQICTRGKSEQVAVKMPEMEMQFEVPGDVTAALGYA
jgi:acyl-CoA thioester hydrolase